MKYSHLLLIFLVISLIWGLVLFVLGFLWRFHQTYLLNNYIAGVESKINAKACTPPQQTEDICPFGSKFEDVELGDWANTFGNLGIITGFIVMAMSVCGAVGVIKKSQPLLITMFLLIVAGIGLQYYILDIVLDGTASFHDDAKTEIKERIASEYKLEKKDANKFTKWFNAVMIQSECCGIAGPEDFNINYTLRVKGDGAIQVREPAACCNSEEMKDEDAEVAWSSIYNCVSSNAWATKDEGRGCQKVVHNILWEDYGFAFTGFLMFLIVWEGLQGILLFMILLRPPPRVTRKSKASSVSSGGRGPAKQDQGKRGSVSRPNIPPKKFIPFSKISSFVSSDVNRIKSTEIW